jgi:1-deoxy-D-xylulose-5-phosphate synthase
VREGADGVIVCIGTPLKDCMDAAAQLEVEGINVSVINARFVKPIDTEMVKRCLTDYEFVVTVEEAMLMGGFGSAFLEEANNQRLSTVNVHRIGIPDEFIHHAQRDEVLADLKLDAAGIASVCREVVAESSEAANGNPVA